MSKVKTVEKRIWDVEGFAVAILHLHGSDVRSDKEGLPMYKYEKAAKNDMTVADWKEIRFKPNYPGFDVAVLNGSGETVHGGTKLWTVRDSYDDD
jgi:hypothetical protein